MMSRTGRLLFVAALAGCATPPPAPGQPSLSVPTVADVESAYGAYIARFPCPEQAICGRSPPRLVFDSRCESGRSGPVTCRFSTSAYHGGPRYTCSALFVHSGAGWSISSLTEPCRFIPWPLPSARDIARLETGLRLDQIIQSVGVADNRSMNRAARVRVRSAACRYLPNHDAICSYQARPCPVEMQAAADSPDDWCWLETRFIHIGGLRPSPQGSEEWAIRRPSTDD